MSVRFNLTLSEELNKAIDEVAEKSETNKSEILRKALTLYLAAKEGVDKGMKLGLVDRETEKLKTEIVGL